MIEKSNLRKLFIKIFLVFTMIFACNMCEISFFKSNVQIASAAGRKSTKIIKTKSDYIKELKKHIVRFDERFEISVSKEVVDENSAKKLINSLVEFKDTVDRATAKVKVYKNYIKIILKLDYIDGYNNYEELKRSIIKTEAELVERIISHSNNVDNNFILNIDKTLYSSENDYRFKEFSDKIFDIPEFTDLLSAKDGYFDRFNHRGSYWQQNISFKTDITKEDLKRLDDYVNTWVNAYISSYMTDEERARKIFEFMINEYSYSYGENNDEVWFYTGDNAKSAKLGKYDIYTSFAPAFYKGGVCSAFSKLFYRLAKASGLESRYIEGDVNDGNKYGHSWNLVKVDGIWYHIDTTWGRGQYEGESTTWVNWDYYLKGDDTMNDNIHKHNWDRNRYPSAPKDYLLNYSGKFIANKKTA